MTMDTIECLERLLNGKYVESRTTSFFRFNNGIEIDCKVRKDAVSFPEYRTYIHDDSSVSEALQNILETFGQILIDYSDERGLEIVQDFDPQGIPELIEVLND